MPKPALTVPCFPAGDPDGCRRINTAKMTSTKAQSGLTPGIWRIAVFAGIWAEPKGTIPHFTAVKLRPDGAIFTQKTQGPTAPFVRSCRPLGIVVPIIYTSMIPQKPPVVKGKRACSFIYMQRKPLKTTRTAPTHGFHSSVTLSTRSLRFFTGFLR